MGKISIICQKFGLLNFPISLEIVTIRIFLVVSWSIKIRSTLLMKNKLMKRFRKRSILDSHKNRNQGDQVYDEIHVYFNFNLN